MALPIDTISYNKAAHYPVGHGYSVRGFPPTSIVVHSTNNSRPTAATQEAEYLMRSADVSAHYLVAKTGLIYQILDPRAHEAWHAGKALQAFQNTRSIGIELHISLGERPTTKQIDALTVLVRDLMREFGIPAPLIETHRLVAVPKGRKRDPEWSDNDFYTWRASLTTCRYRFRDYQPALSSNDVRVAHLAPSVAEWHTFKPGDVVEVDDVTGGMAHIARGVTVEVGPVGFVPLAVLEAV